MACATTQNSQTIYESNRPSNDMSSMTDSVIILNAHELTHDCWNELQHQRHWHLAVFAIRTGGEDLEHVNHSGKPEDALVALTQERAHEGSCEGFCYDEPKKALRAISGLTRRPYQQQERQVVV